MIRIENKLFLIVGDARLELALVENDFILIGQNLFGELKRRIRGIVVSIGRVELHVAPDGERAFGTRIQQQRLMGQLHLVMHGMCACLKVSLAGGKQRLASVTRVVRIALHTLLILPVKVVIVGGRLAREAVHWQPHS